MGLEVQEFVKWLSEIEILDVENIFEILKNEDRKNQLSRYFVIDSKIDYLYEEFLENISGTEKEVKFIENLVNFYPLSKKVIYSFNKNKVKINKKGIPSFFYSEKYMDGYFNAIFKEMQYLKDSSKNNEAIENLEMKIENLRMEIKDFKNQINKFKDLDNNENCELIKERDRLKKEVELLENDLDKNKLEKEIENLKEKKENLENENSKKLQEKIRLKKEIDKINLSENENKEKEAISILKNIWPEDEA